MTVAPATAVASLPVPAATTDGLPDAAPFAIREAYPHEYAEVGEVTYLGFGHGEPGAPQPDAARLRLLRDVGARAAGGDLLVAVASDAPGGSPGGSDAGSGRGSRRGTGTPGRILGTATVLPPGSPLTRQSRDGEAELRLLAVLPDARRGGLGEALMLEGIARARAWGAPALVLDTGPANVRSQRLYHRLGFERLPERETVPASRGGFLAVFRLDFETTDGVLVRLIRPAEYELVGAQLLDAYAHDYDLPASYRRDIVQGVAERARQHETWVAVDRATGAILGSVVTPRPGELITPIGRAGELDFRLLGVDPAARRRGIGRLLTEHVLTLARIRGASRVVMNSGGQMDAAHRLYESLGFAVLHDRVRVFDDGHVSLAYGIDVV